MRLSEFAGNAHIKAVLSGMLSTGRLPHAIVLEGEPGLGKHTLAGMITAGALCTGETHPCGSCTNCRLAFAGTHPDVTVVEPDKGSIKVDAIRDLRQDAYVKPNQAPRRVFLLDGADKMNEAAQNALLKVLEEPPAYALFLLLAESAAALLPTIRSRSIVFSLAPLDSATAVQVVSGLTANHSQEEVEAAVASASGNVGFALRLLEAGNADYAYLDRLLTAVESGTEFDLLTVLKELDGKGGRPHVEAILAQLITRLQRLTAAKAGNRPLPAGTPGRTLTLRKLLQLEAAAEEARRQNAANANMALLLANLCACFQGKTDV